MAYYLILLLLIFWPDEVHLQGTSTMRLDKQEPCADVANEVLLFMTPQNCNRGKQIINVNFTAPYPLGQNILVILKLEKESPLVKNSWIPLISFEVKEGFCVTLEKYMGEFVFDMERAAGLPPKICPVPKGVYHANNFEADFTKLRIPVMPTGKTKITAELYHKQNKQLVLLPTSSSRFPVDLLRVNSSNTLLAVAGSSGVLVLELPERCPPHGGFANNKEMVYCRSHSLDEQLLSCNPCIEVRQVRFHPASQNNTHILVLTSDNALRLYNIVNSSAVALGVYSIGKRPKGVMPGSKSFFLGLLGETAIDFDFGPPELNNSQLYSTESPVKTNPFAQCKELTGRKGTEETHQQLLKNLNDMKLSSSSKNKFDNLEYPIFLLDGLGSVQVLKIDLYNSKSVPKVKGPLPIWPTYQQSYINDACSIICQPCTPPVLCIATVNGTISHSIVLPIDSEDQKLKPFRTTTKYSDPPDRAMYVFETLELELGLATTDTLSDYCCPVFLHPDESRIGHYFATHEAGVHSVTVPALDTLVKVVNGPEDDNLMEMIVNQPSTADYLICTKTATSDEVNPVIGFAVYYDPTSIITLLAQGQVVTSLVVAFTSLPSSEDFMPEDIENFNSPLKQMLSEPFDLKIHRILKQASSQPILKLSGGGERTQQECYELLQRAAQVFREEHFKHHEKAREEIEKRVKVLQMLKRYQTGELQKLNKEKQTLQEKAENLAEKYEDIKDKQDDLKKRCEKLLIVISQKKSEPSEAEKKFAKDLKEAQKKLENYKTSMNRLRNQMKYQEVQMENWKKEQNKKESGLGSIQSHTLKTNLQEMTNQITEMISEVTEYKKQLALN